MIDLKTSEQSPTLPTTPTNPNENVIKTATLRIFSIDRIKSKCILTGKVCFPAVLCEYREEGSKPRKGYVDPEYAFNSGLLSDSDKRRISSLIRSNNSNWQTLSHSSMETYLSTETKEHALLKEVAAWEGADSYNFPELSEERANNWLMSVKRGSVSGITTSLQDYVNLYGNNREQVKRLRDFYYKSHLPVASRLYSAARLGKWLKEQVVEVEAYLAALDYLNSLGILSGIKDVYKTTKFKFSVQKEADKVKALENLNLVFKPWKLELEELDTGDLATKDWILRAERQDNLR